MNPKRDKVSIMRDILLLIRGQGGEAGPTHIMYKANLSHQMLTEYIKELLEKRLIAENTAKKGGRRTYSISGKGHEFLKDYETIRKFLDSYGLA